MQRAFFQPNIHTRVHFWTLVGMGDFLEHVERACLRFFGPTSQMSTGHYEQVFSFMWLRTDRRSERERRWQAFGLPRPVGLFVVGVQSVAVIIKEDSRTTKSEILPFP